MSDLISRQAAQLEQNCVLTMWGECSYAETGCSDCKIKARITKALLPSVQPEMVKCKKCRYVYYDKEFGNYWCDRMSDPFKVEADGYCKWGK